MSNGLGSDVSRMLKESNIIATNRRGVLVLTQPRVQSDPKHHNDIQMTQETFADLIKFMEEREDEMRSW